MQAFEKNPNQPNHTFVLMHWITEEMNYFAQK